MAKAAGDDSTLDPSNATIMFVDRITSHRLETVQAELRSLRNAVNGNRDLVDSKISTVEARLTGVDDSMTMRLNAMDKAAEVLSETVNRVPTALESAVDQINSLQEVKFQAVRDRFELLDKQNVREKAAADLAVQAAFAAADKAAAAQAAASQAAINKSEETTAEVIRKNQEAQQAGQTSLGDKIDDDRDRMNRLEQAISSIQAAGVGANSNRDNTRNNTTVIIAALGVFIALVVAVMTVVVTRSP